MTPKVRRKVRFLTGTDSYKLSHWAQYPDGTEVIYSNLTPRGTRIEGVDEVVFFGLQAFLQDWCGEAFQDFLSLPVEVAVEAYRRRVGSNLGPQVDDYQRIRDLHSLGYLPLEFCAFREGSLVPLRVPMLTVENTHPDFYWLTNYIESVMSAELWHPITSATQAWNLRKSLNAWAEFTGAPSEAVAFQAHDFSFRGLEGVTAAARSGAGHLLSFTGTDIVPALDFVDDFYPGDNGIVGLSVPATEHSVMCAGGKEDERDTFLRLLKTYPTGIVSIVSDTWDLWNVATTILPSLYNEIMSRDGKLVIRPDSGDPVKIICGDPDQPLLTPAWLGLARLLWNNFGGSFNSKGYKVLDPHVGMIYGDSITYERAMEMCLRLKEIGFESTSCVLGVGSFTYQYVTRDTFGTAMKATWAQVNGVGREMFKDPVTDDGTKRSARGRLAVLPGAHGGIQPVINNATPGQEAQSLLQPVWRDGEFLRFQSFADIRHTLGMVA